MALAGIPRHRSAYADALRYVTAMYRSASKSEHLRMILVSDATVITTQIGSNGDCDLRSESRSRDRRNAANSLSLRPFILFRWNDLAGVYLAELSDACAHALPAVSPCKIIVAGFIRKLSVSLLRSTTLFSGILRDIAL